MHTHVRNHLRTNLVGYLALFIALGGVSYAAATLPPNSVGSAQIQDNAVGASEIAANAVGASEIAADAVGASEIAADAVGASEIAGGAVGSGEVADSSLLCQDFNPSEPVCGSGAGGLSNLTIRSKTETLEMTCTVDDAGNGYFYVDCNVKETVTVSCLPGELATGGGHGEVVGSTSAGTAVLASGPQSSSGTPVGWEIVATANSQGDGTATLPPDPQVTVHAVCAS